MNGDAPFDAITTMFVFLIGLPAIIFQWLAPEIRQIIVRRPGELLLDAGLPVALGIAIVCVGLFTPAMPGWGWPAVLATLFALALFTAFRIPLKYVRRTAIVGRLGRRVRRRRRGELHLDEASLLDLVELGKQGQPGQEKELVLQQLLALSRDVCGSHGYDGDRLTDVATGVLDIVVHAAQAGSSQNFGTAAEILEQPLRAFDRATDGFNQTDLLYAIRVLSRIGRAAIRMEDDSVPIAVVQALGSTGVQHPFTAVAISRALFEIGVEAVDHNQMLPAMSAVQSAVALIENGAGTAKDVVADTLGLLAHFWTCGDTGRLYAAPRLAEVEGLIPTDIRTALSDAARHCAQATQFATSDKVHAVLAQYGSDGATDPYRTPGVKPSTTP